MKMIQEGGGASEGVLIIVHLEVVGCTVITCTCGFVCLSIIIIIILLLINVKK